MTLWLEPIGVIHQVRYDLFYCLDFSGSVVLSIGRQSRSLARGLGLAMSLICQRPIDSHRPSTHHAYVSHGGHQSL